ncbi:MAG: helix-turn-helix domain-containing protein [Candidatus Marinimicrobia bacterium]|jgi:excisionase family DNA binding protein|nr:helix-turn-helix domain-containing protein [Candidatus Neomarinimicrobiota bacterium]MBT4360688.1 helix-turn-helix domain-containing protein [Candidatus Neomarinimicrobiota bacterium]MBT4716067.1 helix-turn-helix domain-containing protein [Candidatus Neomarinimicrobiota bacterium]MBT4946073.1 helix-turn-helix domain-containing protein [Candidatus Neomarinimicrobiota bacterium]MBT5269519.1 helix-turn-helix domain-containing protein [Candidatus Neomarinimicrobiota bacterium]
MEQMYSLKSAAKLLDISVKTLRRLLGDSNIQIFRVGQSIRLKESDLKQLVNVERSLDDYRLTI